MKQLRCHIPFSVIMVGFEERCWISFAIMM